jgi:hypothetical protein
LDHKEEAFLAFEENPFEEAFPLEAFPLVQEEMVDIVTFHPLDEDIPLEA